mmetsp:Transcript_21618/g.35802  ORF Transcript_21618/g.35802 Transcript_21618/m.35802 type:complete len:89 (-) Transcript_21618:1187-1453(-)
MNITNKENKYNIRMDVRERWLHKACSTRSNISLYVCTWEVQFLERFHLRKTINEETTHFMLVTIDESANALFPDVVEAFHRWRQYWAC